MKLLLAKDVLAIADAAATEQRNTQRDAIMRQIEVAALKGEGSIDIETATQADFLSRQTVVSLKSLGYTLTEFELCGCVWTNIYWEAAR